MLKSDLEFRDQRALMLGDISYGYSDVLGIRTFRCFGTAPIVHELLDHPAAAVWRHHKLPCIDGNRSFYGGGTLSD